MSQQETVFLFPGQGGYDGRALALARERYPQVGEVFAELDEVAAELFGRPVSEVLDAETDLARLLHHDPWVSQFAIYGAAVAAGRVLLERGVRPDVLVGHSLGEIAALVTAGVFGVADGARIVAHRVRVIEELGVEPGRMVALGADEQRAQHLVELLADDQVAVAAHNHPTQTVLSGPQRSVGRVLGIARLLEIGAVELNSPFAFHSPLLQPAVSALAARIGELHATDPRIPVYSPIQQDYYRPGQDVAALIAQHLVRPVRFAAAVAHLREAGAHRFVEVGGATALAQLVRRNVDHDDVSTWSTLALDRTGGLALDATLAALAGPAPADPEAVARLGEVLAPGTSAEVFAEFWAAAGERIAASVRAELAEFTAGRDATPAPPAQPVVIDKDVLAKELRAQYAAALEYPEEVFGDDVRLEAELGIDSVKQVELVSRAFQRYGLPEREGGIRISEYDTIAKVVELVHSALREQAAR
ncbi:hypothetical protein GCM10011581_03130 [Saccharopolyspora subtropica]|uniref:Carrier domain-containing protein n=1 Tax=Saccharopolyspora thermophila TaxID=89367 RepID=A0A917N841_9PSEU|nr:acyltransferase domain-containing protein [Saccharopolyspora subtropica]GGI69507.1 hypothetical protein GCM10011581_03130 [Saccharopolyspora subtropica]